MAIKQLHERKWDWLFIIVFSFFAFTSFFVDMMGALHELFLGSENPWFMKTLLMQTYADCDPLFVINPPFMRVALVFSALVWGPLYLYFIWGFIKGKNAIRIPALMYSSALTVVMLMIFSEELFSQVPGWASPLPWKFTAYNLPYLLMPLLLAFRMRSPNPFGDDEGAA